MSYELGRALLVSEIVTPAALQGALFASVTHDVHLVRALLSSGAVDPETLDVFLARTEASVLRHVVPLSELVLRLPAKLCARLLVVPVRLDPVTGTVDVAMADVRDLHAAREVRFHLKMPVRPVRATLAAIEEALDRLAREGPPTRETLTIEDDVEGPFDGTLSHPPGDTPPWGTPMQAVPQSDAPIAGVGSEIPIPLTRRTYAPIPGGTQRPPPILLSMGGAPRDDDDEDLDRREAAGERITRSYLAVPMSAPPPREVVYDLGVQAPRTSLIPGPPPQVSLRAATQSYFPPDAGVTVAAMKSAFDRDQVLDLLMSGSRAVARRVAIFVVKRGGFVGWACTPDFGERVELQALLIPLTQPSVLTIAVNEGLYLGALRHDEVHAPILRVMKTASRDVAACGVRVAGKPALVILADDLGDTMIATRRLEELARVAGDALGRILRARR